MAPAPAPAPLPPWLGDPRSTVIRVEAFVVVASILLFFQLIFGSWRRQSSNKLIQGSVWVAYTLSFPLITYTLGMMQSSPVKSPLYPVWATSLFLVAGCTNSITAYDLDDNKQWKRHLFELLQYYVYAAMVVRLLSPVVGIGNVHAISDVVNWTDIQPIVVPFMVLIVMIFVTNSLRVIACWMVNLSDPSKVVADYMRDLQSQVHDPITMEGYEYLVQWHGYKNMLRRRPGGVVTIDKIWQERQFDSQLKDVCLSFSLFHLLKRRFFGMYCYEAERPESRDFVLRGLLSQNGHDYARAFRIIEVELGFLHDFFFTRYASVYENEFVFFVTLILKIIFTVMLGVFVYRNSMRLKTYSPIIEVDIKTIDTIITLVILGALIIVEIFQAMLYLASDWALVSFACSYVRNRSCQAMRYSLRWPIWMFRRQSLFKYWQNKIGQYSVIEGCHWHVSPLQVFRRYVSLRPAFDNILLLYILLKLYMLLFTVLWKICTCQYCRSIVDSVSLPDSVKKQIALSFRSSNGRLTNGEVSLQQNIVDTNTLSRFTSTLNREDRSQTDTILIWHIATNYCEIVVRQVAEGGYHEVATKLSRYCAYLMAFAPGLLPGNSADTKFTFDRVMEEAAAKLPRGKDDIGDRAVVDNLLRRNNNTIFVKGLKLGRELERIDNSVRWKVMAEFWAEMILYVAPSDNVRGHIEQLANGGEFLTHVWALLFHAGILTRR